MGVWVITTYNRHMPGNRSQFYRVWIGACSLKLYAKNSIMKFQKLGLRQGTDTKSRFIRQLRIEPFSKRHERCCNVAIFATYLLRWLVYGGIYCFRPPETSLVTLVPIRWSVLSVYLVIHWGPRSKYSNSLRLARIWVFLPRFLTVPTCCHYKPGDCLILLIVVVSG